MGAGMGGFEGWGVGTVTLPCWRGEGGGEPLCASESHPSYSPPPPPVGCGYARVFTCLQVGWGVARAEGRAGGQQGAFAQGELGLGPCFPLPWQPLPPVWPGSGPAADLGT